jgi:hypothetical protein
LRKHSVKTGIHQPGETVFPVDILDAFTKHKNPHVLDKQ